MVLFENQPFQTPSGAWARVIVRNEISFQQSLGAPGSRRYERGGRVLVSIFVPSGSATNTADEHAEVARNAFEGKRLTSPPIRFESSVVVRETGIVEDDWHQVVVDAEFVYNEIR